jgi:hypothetical protein
MHEKLSTELAFFVTSTGELQLRIIIPISNRELPPRTSHGVLSVSDQCHCLSLS